MKIVSESYLEDVAEALMRLAELTGEMKKLKWRLVWFILLCSPLFFSFFLLATNLFDGV
ncbi:MAG: hypothetical protein GY780_00155 [bacterium]|nr:hypothetical protein [bacterium]